MSKWGNIVNTRSTCKGSIASIPSISSLLLIISFFWLFYVLILALLVPNTLFYYYYYLFFWPLTHPCSAQRTMQRTALFWTL
ncbi:hypothetical protein LI328DRAFT_134451 [Trichoderma asperelloides]|nr:hypothetical protein LI328DRAFT_134451 [Trichoderma asperelloides]